MPRRFAIRLTLACLAAALAAAPALAPPAAALPLAETSGTVTGFDQDQSLLNVNTRLGPRLFLITSNTTVLMNNHGATIQDLQAGDPVEVEFRFDTSEAFIVHAFRQAKQKGNVATLAANSVGLRIRRNAVTNYTRNAQTAFLLNDIRLEDPEVLLNLGATAIFEPGAASPLLLRLAGTSKSFSGRVSALGMDTVTVTGKKVLVFTLHEAVTIREGDAFLEPADLMVGDRVTVAFNLEEGVRTARAILIRS